MIWSRILNEIESTFTTCRHVLNINLKEKIYESYRNQNTNTIHSDPFELSNQSHTGFISSNKIGTKTKTKQKGSLILS